MSVQEYLAEKHRATADQIRHAIGMTHEQVYERLVQLEAKGILRMATIGKHNQQKRLWEFA